MRPVTPKKLSSSHRSVRQYSISPVKAEPGVNARTGGSVSRAITPTSSSSSSPNLSRALQLFTPPKTPPSPSPRRSAGVFERKPSIAPSMIGSTAGTDVFADGRRHTPVGDLRARRAPRRDRGAGDLLESQSAKATQPSTPIPDHLGGAISSAAEILGQWTPEDNGLEGQCLGIVDAILERIFARQEPSLQPIKQELSRLQLSITSRELSQFLQLLEDATHEIIRFAARDIDRERSKTKAHLAKETSWFNNLTTAFLPSTAARIKGALSLKQAQAVLRVVADCRFNSAMLKLLEADVGKRVDVLECVSVSEFQEVIREICKFVVKSVWSV